MLNELNTMMAPGDSITLTLTRNANDLRVVVQPRMAAGGAVADTASAEQKALAQVKAALTVPLIVTLTTADPDHEIVRQLAEYANVRTEAINGLNALTDAISASGRSASNAAAAVQAKAKAKTTKPDTAAVPAPPSTTSASVPESASDDSESAPPNLFGEEG